jgi:PilZ domain
MSAALPLRNITNQPDDQELLTREGVSWRATYTYKVKGFRYTDEACIRDVSRNGCGIRGRTCLAVGSQMTITFYLMDQQRPLAVPAKVACITDEFFEVQFLHLSKQAYERMQRYMRPQERESSVQETPLQRKRRNFT